MRTPVGLTGGIATGKSTVSAWLAADGARLAVLDLTLEAVLDRRPAAPITVKEVSAHLLRLVEDLSWLAPEARVGREDSYCRHLLHKDRQNRFVILALVIGGGDGGSSEELLKHSTIERVVMAELDPISANTPMPAR